MNKRFSFQVSQYLKKRRGIVSLLSLGLFLALGLAGFGKGVLPDTFWRVSAASQQGDNTAALWQEVDEKTIPTYGHRNVNPQKYKTLQLNAGGLKQLLSAAPLAQSMASRDIGLPVSLPMPDGSFARFLIVESPILAPELAKQSPEIKTYRGQGIDDPTATMRCSLTPLGFQTLILSSTGTVLIETYAKNDAEHYLSYNLKDLPAAEVALGCAAGEIKKNISALSNTESASLVTQNVSFGGTLRTYRLAVAATSNYTAANGGKDSTFEVITSIVNQITAIYERDLGIHLQLVDNEKNVIYDGTETWYPFNPQTVVTDQQLFAANQSALNDITHGIQSANYDIGHVFGVGAYGVAARSSVCSSIKAHGTTRLPSPTGIGFTFLAAHEMGHQFGASHTHNGSVGSCGNLQGDQRATESAYEPGSGSTIMSYAGTCADSSLPTQNITSQRDPYFHTKSIEQIISYITSGGGSCVVPDPINNTPPTVEAGQNYIIPKATPFTLTAVGNDTDGDSLTYTWEEYDLGAVSPPDTDADGQARPIFRSRPPTASASRTFPDLAYIRDYANVSPTYIGGMVNGLLAGESLPMITRTMQFVVTARDNHLSGGGVASDNMQVTVDGSSEPFFITSQGSAEVWTPGTTKTITWNVGSTATSPINCSQVNILLSLDGGNNFTTLLPGTANDGSEMITVPNTPSTAARIKVEAVGNIFFDISDANFVIPATGCGNLSISPPDRLDQPAGGTNKSFTVSNTTSTSCSYEAKSNVDWIIVTSNASGMVSNSSPKTVTYNIQPNTSGGLRWGTISAAGQTHTVSQLGGCTQTITPSQSTFTFSGGSGAINVTGTCNWNVSSEKPWVTIISGKLGAGPGTVIFSVAKNTSGARSCKITVGGQDYTVSQEGFSSGVMNKLSGVSFGTSPAGTTGREYDKAFDGNVSTFFDFSSANGGYTGIDLGAGNARKIVKLRYFPRSDYSVLLNRMLNGRFQGSNDGSTYVDLYQIPVIPAISSWVEVTITNLNAYRYLRYLSPNGSYGNVAEVEFYTDGSAPPPPTTDYIGWVDSADCTEIRGWAADRLRLNTPITVSIYDGGNLIASGIQANQFNAGVGSYLGDNGNHSFVYPVPPGSSLKNGAAHTVHVRYESSLTAGLNDSPKTVGPCGSTTNYDGWVDSANCTDIRGWAADRNRLNTSITVSIYDGPVLIASGIQANQFNAGVGSYLGDNGNHSFVYTIPSTSPLKYGPAHTVRVVYESSTTDLHDSPKTVGPCGGTTNYDGWLDAASCTEIRGWAADRNRLGTSLTVSIYDGSIFLASVQANQFNAGVGAYVGDSGFHSFVYTVPAGSSLKNGGTHTVRVKYESSNIELYDSPKTVGPCSGARLHTPSGSSLPFFEKRFGEATLPPVIAKTFDTGIETGLIENKHSIIDQYRWDWNLFISTLGLTNKQAAIFPNGA